MTLELLTLELHRHADSWIGLLTIGNVRTRSLFYIEWNRHKRIHILELLFIKII